jgi:hypothetical protein
MVSSHTILRTALLGLTLIAGAALAATSTTAPAASTAKPATPAPAAAAPAAAAAKPATATPAPAQAASIVYRGAGVLSLTKPSALSTAACAGKTASTSCQYTDPKGVVKGLCASTKDKFLACVPAF